MTDHRDNESERDIDALRASYSALPKAAPDEAVDARIRAAARRRRRLLSPVWLGAIGAAACVGLAVVLVPALLVQAPHERMRAPAAELVILQSERPPTEKTAREEDSAARAVAPMMAPPPSAALAIDQALNQSDAASLARESETARAKAREQRRELRMAPEASAGFADSQAQEDSQLERVQVTGSRVRSADLEAAAKVEFLNEVRARLADADAAAWREQILALRSGEDDRLAQALLADFRIRFDRPETFTLDDLAQEQAAAKADNK